MLFHLLKDMSGENCEIPFELIPCISHADCLENTCQLPFGNKHQGTWSGRLGTAAKSAARMWTLEKLLLTTAPRISWPMCPFFVLAECVLFKFQKVPVYT